MATKSKPVETAAAAPNRRAQSRRGQVRYSISRADLRERGIYEEPRGLPLPNVADLMSYLLKGMVLFLVYNVVRGVWPESAPSAPPLQEQRAQLPAPKPAPSGGSGAMKQLENLNETINSATEPLLDRLRDLIRKDPADL